MYRHALVLAGGVEASEPAMRGAARHRARRLRALLPGLPVRGLGRQAGARGARRRDVRDAGSGVAAGIFARSPRRPVTGSSARFANRQGCAYCIIAFAGDDESTAMTASASSTQSARPLAHLPARSSWSAPARWAARCWKAGWRAAWRRSNVVVLEPQPARRSRALAGARRAPQSAPGRDRRGRRRSWSRSSRRSRPRCCRRSRRWSAPRPSSSRSWPGARLRFLEAGAAARRARARHAEHAGRDRPRHHRRGRQCARVGAQRELVDALLVRRRRGRMGRRRSADGRGDRGVGLRPGLCVPAGRSAGARRRRRRPAAPRSPRSSRARPSRAPANCCIARRSTQPRCGRTSPRRAAPPRPRSTC